MLETQIQKDTAIVIEELPPYYMKFFKYDHLPEHLQKISKEFYELAEKMYERVPRNQERSAGLRKLLEAKDCMVRGLL